MTVDRSSLGSFGDLAVALGLLDPTSGEPNAGWFSDPVTGGSGGDAHGLEHVLADPDQRAALLHFVDQVLGPPDAPVREGATWVPLFANDDPTITVYGVVEQVGGEVRVGVGFDHTTRGGPPSVTSRIHVPLFRFADRGQSLRGGGPAPDWMLLGRAGGDITFSLDATLSDATPQPGDPSLGGASLSVTVPTETPDVGFELTLRDLQLPGAAHPETFTLDVDHADQLGPSVLNLLSSLVRAQADALGSSLESDFQAFAALAGMLGLRDVEHLDPLPIADLPTEGVQALVGWVEGVLDDSASRDAWLDQLATLVGGEVNDDGDAVVIPVGTATGVGRIAVTVGVRVTPGTGGHPVLVPWVEVSLASRTAVVARAAVDVLSVDTGTGSVVAVPDARIETVFGDKAHPLVASAPALAVGTVRVGVALDAQHHPAFVLTATDVTVDGATRATVDLSSPDAALAAGADLVTGALVQALQDLGDAGDLVARLLGVTATGGVTAISVPALVADPVGTIRQYWKDVLADTHGAMSDLLGRLSALVRGTAAELAPGTGEPETPWLVTLVDADGVAVRLEAWRDGDVLHVDTAAVVDRTVLTDYTLTSRVSIGVATLDFAAPRATFATGATLAAALTRSDDTPARIALAPLALNGSEIAVEATWRPTTGARVRLRSDDLALEIADGAPIHLPLPVIGPTGSLTLETPDWDEIEAALAGLVGQLGLPELRAGLALVGWEGTGPRLALGDLLSGNPATVSAAIEAWLADLLLECDVVRDVLGPVAALLSAFSLSAPLGSGTAADPYRCPVAGAPRAPGLRVWLDPGCPPRPDPLLVDPRALLASTPPDPATVVSVLRRAGEALPDLADLLVGRDSVDQGLAQLLVRLQDTDGVTGRPATMPDGVNAVTFPGLSYAELVAAGRTGVLGGRVLGGGAGDVVHVATEADVLAGRADGTTVDLSGDGPIATLPAGVGPWFVRLPTPAAAAAARPDRGGVGEQAARIQALLTGRAQGVALVGYGAAGAATLRAAASLQDVTDVVTVGAPWSEPSTLAFEAGLSGDALQLLRRLQRAEVPAWPDQLLGTQCTPLQRMRLLVQRALDPAARDLPRADAETRRDGVRVHAVFGAIDQLGLARSLAAYAADAISVRTPAADQPDVEQHAVHLAVDVPVLDLDLGGLLVGAGAVFEACQVTRDGGGLSVSLLRSLTVELHLGVHDGWLVGGPGSDSSTGDVRWVDVKVVIPFDGTVGSSELVLHEAQGLGIDKEAWLVRAGEDSVTATGAVPEVRVLVGDVVTRLRSASPRLEALLSRFALLDGARGLDLTGFDRFLHDPAATLRGQVAAGADEVAEALRALVPAATGSGSVVGWTVGDATLGCDLATGALTAELHTSIEGLLPVAVDVAAAPTTAYATVAIGGIDDHLGGARLVLATPQGGSGASVRGEWASAGGTRTTVPLWPALDTAGLTSLVTVTLPAIALEGVVGALRATLSDAALEVLEAGLTACGLLRPRTYGGAAVRLPIAFVADPPAYVVAVGRQGSGDVAAAGVALLDSLAHLFTTIPTSGTWPIADGVELRYAEVDDTLEVSMHVELDENVDGTRIRSGLDAGVVLRPGLVPAPAVGLSVLVDELGLALHLDPGLRVEMVRAAPLAPLPLYPEGPGLGQVFATAAQTLVPELLDRVAALAGGSAGLAKDVGSLVAELGDALELREGGHFTAARITTFAGDPAGALAGHLAGLVGSAAAALAKALNGNPARVSVTQAAGTVTFSFGTAPDTVTVTLDATGPTPAVEVGGSWEIPDVGVVRVDGVRLSTAGVAVSATLGPFPVQAGAVTLRPLLTVAAGTASATGVLGLGLALDDAGEQSVELRWGLDATPPVLVAVDRGDSPLVSEAGGPTRLLAVGVGLASGVLVGALPDGFLDARAIRMLHGVVFAEDATTPAIDPGVVLDLLDPERLLLRVERLLWNAATDTQPLSVTIGDTVTIALAAVSDGPARQLGISVTLPTGKRLKLADDDTVVELEVDPTWITPTQPPAGLTILALRGTKTGDTFDFELAPGVLVGGVGLRFTKASGPLLSLGAIALDGFAVRVYAECDTAGVGGGAQVAMLGLAVAPAGAGGNNSVANGIMADAGKASPAQRPAFSPALAIQQHPHEGLGVSIRAGDPPGPWWILVQRQLGPLYVERVGFDEKETDGKVSRIALLFDGGVSIFGLSAQVDQLSITWLGGDLLDIHQWAVDLMGLAVSADMSGVTLAGGLLKTVDQTGNPAYVGMLIGKFGIYGLSVFGGYTSLGGAPSFFVFGAFNGPIGGPPAFFLTGIGGGLGINRKLVAPTDPAQMDEFPFIQALDPYAQVPEPMAELKKLAEIFPPELDNFWFAAGISFTCFSLVDGVAVVAVSFGQGLEIDLLGLARLALPNPAAALVSIELGLLARFSTTEGVFLIQAALTDNSWLLYEDVRLTGGFAFATWWKGPLAGQFVLTIGGYHPDFHVDGYPVVPRLGLCWQVTDDISIKGGSYFALTSEALMAGVGVDAVADFGWAWAKASFGADGLVYFDPFWYDVAVRASISAGIEIDTWLGTISFSVTTGCGVHVWGPDFSGEASVEVGPCSVTIPFGSDAKREGKRLDWGEFTAKYLEDAGGGAARALSGITGRGSLPSATDGGKSAPPPDGTAGHPFEVTAEFEITLVTTVPSSHIDLEASVVPVSVVRSDGAPAALGLNPMKTNVSDSVLRVRLERFDDDTSTWQPDPTDLAQLGHSVGTGSFPIGVWGPPSPGGSTTVPDRLPSGDVLVAGSQVTLTAAAAGQAVGPEIDYYKVEAGKRRPLPFTARQAQRVSLMKLAAKVPLPAAADAGAAVSAARDILFAARSAPDPTSPLLATGVRSQVAHAGFRGGLAGPPLFGNLTDGLAVANAAGVVSSPQPPPPPPQPPRSMDPRVVGFFAAGAAVAFRSPLTTVVDRVARGPAKRRPAPTTESVHARLGAHLPISLQVSASPAVAMERTVTPASIPFSGVASSARSYRLGDAAALTRVAGIGGLGGTALPAPKARAAVARANVDVAAPTLASGDVVVLHAPDHATDVSELRPTLDVGGTGRVTCLRGDGRVLSDDVRSGVVDVPVGTALLAVQADAVTTGLDGCAGWHTRSRVAGLGPSAALAAGAAIVVESGLTPAEPGWTTAGDFMRGAARVLTRFSSPVRAVALVVESDQPDRVGDMGLLLEGATRAVGSDGRPLDPHLVMNGVQSIAIYEVVAEPAAGAVQVSAAPGGDWRLTGVLGSDQPADAFATLLLRRGLVTATARLTATTGAGCSPVWGAAPSRPKSSAKKATAKKPTAKKATKKATAKKATAKKATKKATAKKATAKKATAKKATAKKATAKKATAKKTTATKTTATKTTSGRGTRGGR